MSALEIALRKYCSPSTSSDAVSGTVPTDSLWRHPLHGAFLYRVFPASDGSRVLEYPLTIGGMALALGQHHQINDAAVIKNMIQAQIGIMSISSQPPAKDRTRSDNGPVMPGYGETAARMKEVPCPGACTM